MRGFPNGDTPEAATAALITYAAAIADIVQCVGPEELANSVQHIVIFSGETNDTARERVAAAYRTNLEGHATDLDWLMAKWAGTWGWMPMPIDVRQFFGRKFPCADGQRAADILEAAS